jgi:hypothetical protein
MAVAGYPDATAAGEGPTHLIGRGLQRVAATLGLQPAPQLDAAKVYALLRADAEALKTAATPEQRALLNGEPDKVSGAVWTNTPEGQERVRQDKRQTIAAIEQEWGPGASPEWT